jgi:hypothetical protein
MVWSCWGDWYKIVFGMEFMIVYLEACYDDCFYDMGSYEVVFFVGPGNERLMFWLPFWMGYSLDNWMTYTWKFLVTNKDFNYTCGWSPNVYPDEVHQILWFWKTLDYTLLKNLSKFQRNHIFLFISKGFIQFMGIKQNIGHLKDFYPCADVENYLHERGTLF